jgi:tripartite-type tricarboxylate transporter receptor subunit TctC
MKRLGVLSLCAMIMGLALLPGSGIAQQKSYPEKPITLLVPYGAGGASDQLARGLAEAAKKRLRQPIVVVNRPEASGTRAMAEALGSTPDGYTLALARSPLSPCSRIGLTCRTAGRKLMCRSPNS